MESISSREFTEWTIYRAGRLSLADVMNIQMARLMVMLASMFTGKGQPKPKIEDFLLDLNRGREQLSEVVEEEDRFLTPVEQNPLRAKLGMLKAIFGGTVTTSKKE